MPKRGTFEHKMYSTMCRLYELAMKQQAELLAAQVATAEEITDVKLLQLYLNDQLAKKSVYRKRRPKAK